VVQLAVPGFIAFMVLEILVGRATGRARYETRDTVTSLLMGVGNLAVGFLPALGIGALLYQASQHALLDVGWSWPVFLIAFVLNDLRYYCYHRIAHRMRWWWAGHVNHHSSQHYNLSTALRQEWSGQLTFAAVLWTPLVWLGFPIAMLVFVNGLNLVYQFWIHTELIDRFPAPIEAVFNTPSHHRVHHATNPQYLDANYAGTLILWDRLFGSFVPEDADDPCRYGLTSNLGTFNPLRVAFHEWAAMLRDVARPGLSARQRLGYFFGPPGWSHDGSRVTTADRKAAHARRAAEGERWTSGTSGPPG